MTTLVIAEHDNASIKSATRNTITAAAELGAEITLLVVGTDCQAAANEAASIAGDASGRQGRRSGGVRCAVGLARAIPQLQFEVGQRRIREIDVDDVEVGTRKNRGDLADHVRHVAISDRDTLPCGPLERDVGKIHRIADIAAGQEFFELPACHHCAVLFRFVGTRT